MRLIPLDFALPALEELLRRDPSTSSADPKASQRIEAFVLCFLEVADELIDYAKEVGPRPSRN